jgi:N-acetylglucosamine kinase-like BadF-type ATPase
MGLLVAVDGGGSKTDVVALRADGTVHGRVRGGRTNPQNLGLAPAVRRLDELIEQVVGDQQVDAVHLYLSGLDLPREVAALRAAVTGRRWAAGELVARNDLVALLRAGTQELDAAVAVCGTGINAFARRADGATAGFAALGAISGDWGGGWALGEEALWHAARAVDGRGGPTALVEAVPRALGLDSVQAVTEALHFGELASTALNRLAPTVLALARDGDEIAGSLVDRLAAEVVTMVAAALGRLDLADRDVPVVLGGGVLAADDPRLIGAIGAGLVTQVPAARPVLVRMPPIVGAVALALEAAGAPVPVVATAMAAVADRRP